MKLSKLIWILTMLSAFAGISRAMAADGLPTPADLLAGYQQNVARFPRPRVAWAYRTAYHEPFFRLRQLSAEESEEIARKPGLSDQERRQMSEDAKSERSIIAACRARPTFARYNDFWTDRRGCLYRLPPMAYWIDGPPPGWSFPDDECTPATLMTAFKNSEVYSFTPDSLPSQRIWSGVSKYGQYNLMFGEWRPKKIDESVTGFQFPPLCAVPDAMAYPSSLNVIDEFFSRPVSEMQVERRELLQGRATYVLVHRRVEPSNTQHTTPGDLKKVKIVSAWIDPARGCLPLKITWDNAWLLDGKTIGDEWRQPFQVFECTKIERVGNGYYPMNGFRGLCIVDPDSSGPDPHIDKVLMGQARYRPYVKEQTLSWEVFKVEPDRATSAAMFELEFPKGTIYHDATTSRSFLQGGTEAEMHELLDKADASARREARRGLLKLVAIGGAVLAALTAAGAFAVQWGKRRDD